MQDDEIKKDESNKENLEGELLDALHVDLPKKEDKEDISYEESDEDGDVLPTRYMVKKLRDDLKQARAEKQEYLTGWQRSKADYVNLQKSEEKKRNDLRDYIRVELVEDLMPALDSFDMAFANKEAWEKVDANWRSGVEYIQKQFIQALEMYGVSKIDQVNVKFDPMLHESVESVKTDDESKDHTVESIIQSGYKMGDRVIRPARVKIFEFKK